MIWTPHPRLNYWQELKRGARRGVFWEFRSMMASSISARPRHARRRASTGAACAAAAVLMLLAPAARAQNLFFLFEPAPLRIERQLESAGYELRGPLVRRGDVYVADVVGQTGARERLIVDARTARIVDRFPSVATRWREGRFGDWRDDENSWNDAPPRPPQGVALTTARRSLERWERRFRARAASQAAR